MCTRALTDEHLPTNIGNPQEITLLQFAERVREHFENVRPNISSYCRRTTRSSAARTSPSEEHPRLGAEGRGREGLQVMMDYFTEQFAMNSRAGALASERKARRADHSKPLWPLRISAAHVWEIEKQTVVVATVS